MIPEIGLMIGAYIVTRMVRLALKRDPREHVIVIVCSLATVVITGLVVADLLNRGSGPLGDLTTMPPVGGVSSASRAKPSTAEPTARFGIGSTKDDVLKIQGTPTQQGANVFTYGTASVVFGADGRVVTWVDPNGTLRAR